MNFSKEEILKFCQKYSRQFIYGIVIIVLGILSWQYKKFYNSPKVVIHPVKVSLSKTKRQDIENYLKLIASVYASESVAIKARIDSQITKINFHDGDKIEEGQILFELDDRVLKAQYQQQQAILEKDQAEVDRSSLKYERDQKLAKKGFVSSEQLDTSKQAFKSANATLQSDKAMFDNLKTQLDYTIIKAPISGRVGTIKLTVGNFVKANDTESLVIINKVQPIKVQAAVPQEYYEDVKKVLTSPHAMDMVVLNPKGEVIEKGTLEYRENSLDESTRTLAVRGIFKNNEDNLWPGMFTDVKLKIGIDKGVLTIPEEAVQNGQKGQYIFVVKDQKAHKVNIKLIRVQDSLAIIEGDLKEGETVVTDGILLVKEGSLVESISSESLIDSNKTH